MAVFGAAAALALGAALGFLARPELIGSGSAPALAVTPKAPIASPEPPPPSAPTMDRLETPPPELQAAAEPEPLYRTGFDCGLARAGAEEMVCADPALAAADRRLALAYRRAMGAGAAAGELLGEQLDWEWIREDAARRSSRALAQVYEQRIQELNELAEAAGGEEAPPPPDLSPAFP